MANVKQLFDSIRATAKSEFEKGDYFARAVALWMRNDPIYKDQFSRVQPYAEWAVENGKSAADHGIDLVATRVACGGFVAIQCKFYDEATVITWPMLSTFIGASETGKGFVGRMLIDTTGGNFSKVTQDEMATCPGFSRVSVDRMEESPVDFSSFMKTGSVAVAVGNKKPKEHQKEALGRIVDAFEDADRATIVMACGTGKTYTGLMVSEDSRVAGKGKRVLFMVPSLALMSQTIGEWAADKSLPFRAFAACSDSQVDARKNDDAIASSINDLQYPATTDPMKLAKEAKQNFADGITVVYSTYQSIDVIAEAQKQGLPDFDLIICDEAHRTTGVTLDAASGDDESPFKRIHDNAIIHGRKRLYMTATPKIFGQVARDKADEAGATIASMDDKSIYGEQAYTYSFGRAVANGLLSDYKVIVLAVDERQVAPAFQKQMDQDGKIQADDATKLIGCWKALGTAASRAGETIPLRRAIAYTSRVKTSETIAKEFRPLIENYLEVNGDLAGVDGHQNPDLVIQAKHVDGAMGSDKRVSAIQWLKEGGQDDECRVLVNARCLTEGVDVPALDAVMFLSGRSSKVDIVQAVGRVMRRAEGKDLGYVILPVIMPHGANIEKRLRSDDSYKVIWDVLNALRAHDARLDGEINKSALGEQTDKILILPFGGHDAVQTVDEVDLTAPTKNSGSLASKGASTLGGAEHNGGEWVADIDQEPTLPIANEFTIAIRAKIVEKCGKKVYWDNWGDKVAAIAARQAARIHHKIENDDAASAAFDAFISEMKASINDGVTHDQAVQMLAQHIITGPVFQAIFSGYDFVARNPVSIALQKVVDAIPGLGIHADTEELAKFYDDVQGQVSAITTDAARQELIKRLYDKFFDRAFNALTKQMGIVYTPVEIVDFIIESVASTLRTEFGQELGDDTVHIIDPFTGTGTFITRLLQSGHIPPHRLAAKYGMNGKDPQIHANEIVLLAYYIAAINIEATFHALLKGEYECFPGICFTDTFEMWENNPANNIYEHAALRTGMKENEYRRQVQKKNPIRVIIGNPPYSAGKKSQNDKGGNRSYPNLDRSIADTYVERSTATASNKLYDSYIRAIRWGGERLGQTGGILAYVSGNAWLDRSFADGMRRTLADEFTSIHVVDLRGDGRKEMLSKGRAGEGGNVFNQGSMTGICITIFVRNPMKQTPATIHYHNIGDRLTTQQKLDMIAGLGGIDGITEAGAWTDVVPDKHGDWLSHRVADFEAHMPIGGKNANGEGVFSTYSLGSVTNRDAWAINSSRTALIQNMQTLVDTYNGEKARLANDPAAPAAGKQRRAYVDGFVTEDATRISWSANLKDRLSAGTEIEINPDRPVITTYRPFGKQWLYFDRLLNERVSQLPSIYPHQGAENQTIVVSGPGSRSGFSTFITNTIPNLDLVEKAQAFPRYVYVQKGGHGDMLDDGAISWERQDAISPVALNSFRVAYPEIEITAEDVFHYVYGVLHNEEYRTHYASNLSKELPRIPLASSSEDYRAFVTAGRELAALHLGYETVDPLPLQIIHDGKVVDVGDVPEAAWKVKSRKMRLSSKNDRRAIEINAHLTIGGIPAEAWEYEVNGIPAIEWVMKEQFVYTDKPSGIVNDANAYATETMHDASYCAMLVGRVARVSVETMKIVRSLPALTM